MSRFLPDPSCLVWDEGWVHFISTIGPTIFILFEPSILRFPNLIDLRFTKLSQTNLTRPTKS